MFLPRFRIFANKTFANRRPGISLIGENLIDEVPITLFVSINCKRGSYLCRQIQCPYNISSLYDIILVSFLCDVTSTILCVYSCLPFSSVLFSPCPFIQIYQSSCGKRLTRKKDGIEPSLTTHALKWSMYNLLQRVCV